MPVLAILLSILGLVPFIVCGLAALGPDPVTATRMLTTLIDYAALVLAFSAGIHWGFELQSPQQNKVVGRARLGIAAAALTVAWIAIVLPIVTVAWLTLVILIAAYIGAVLVEQEAAKRALMPPHYLWLRWGFTIIAAAMLVTVLTLHLLGRTVVF